MAKNASAEALMTRDGWPNADQELTKSWQGCRNGKRGQDAGRQRPSTPSTACDSAWRRGGIGACILKIPSFPQPYTLFANGIG